VERDDEDDRLPVAYQRVTEWLADGVSPEDMAARLGIDPAAVPALIELAVAKLARATDEAQQEPDPAGDGP
jgi:hypothetical protein